MVTQNSSPRLNRAEFATQQSPEVYDVCLQRKENEGFGFVILTSKNKPPPGGECCALVVWSLPGLTGAEVSAVQKFSMPQLNANPLCCCEAEIF